MELSIVMQSKPIYVLYRNQFFLNKKNNLAQDNFCHYNHSLGVPAHSRAEVDLSHVKSSYSLKYAQTSPIGVSFRHLHRRVMGDVKLFTVRNANYSNGPKEPHRLTIKGLRMDMFAY